MLDTKSSTSRLDDDDFETALRTAQAAYDQHQPDVVVGSSRGGAVALNINSEHTPLVLLCPAWKNWGTVKMLRSISLLLHSRQDEVIPFAVAEELVADSGLPSETLIEVGSDHRLADDESLTVMLWACNLLASVKKLPSTTSNSHQSAITPKWITHEPKRTPCSLDDARRLLH